MQAHFPLTVVQLWPRKSIFNLQKLKHYFKLLIGFRQKVNADSTGETDSWRVKYLLRLEVDLPKMNSRADRQVYRNFAQFRLDAQTLVHNVSVYHGG